MCLFVLLVFILLLLVGCFSGLCLNIDYILVNQDSCVQFIVFYYIFIDLLYLLGIFIYGGVSVYYLIGDDELVIVYCLVDENCCVWYVGVSEWQGWIWLNVILIGIEIVNQGYCDIFQGWVWYLFSEVQIQVLIFLLKDIVKCYGIILDWIIGYSDIVLGCKVDLGLLFFWKCFVDVGLVFWLKFGELVCWFVELNGQLLDVCWFQQQLVWYGYLVLQIGELEKDICDVIGVFQMKYCLVCFDGELDLEIVVLLLVVLIF